VIGKKEGHITTCILVSAITVLLLSAAAISLPISTIDTTKNVYGQTTGSGNQAILTVPPSATNAYKDSIGNIHIIGQVQNNFTFPIRFVQVIATLYDVNKRVVDTGNAYSDVDQLSPGEKSGFDIILTGNNGAISNVTNYALGTSYEMADTGKTPSLNISTGQGYSDSIGNYHLVGEVANQGSNTTRFVKVSGIFFDANKRVVDVATTYTTPSDLRTGQKAPFDLLSLSPNANKIKFASVDVQSEDYSRLGTQPYLVLSQKPLSTTTTTESSGGGGGGGGTHNPHKLLVAIGIAKDPIVRGNDQTISVTVSDSKKPDTKIAGAKVSGKVDYPSHETTKTFSGITDGTGQMVPIYTWKIGPASHNGTATVTAKATKAGYSDASAVKTFQIICKFTSECGHMVNQTNSTILKNLTNASSINLTKFPTAKPLTINNSLGVPLGNLTSTSSHHHHPSSSSSAGSNSTGTGHTQKHHGSKHKKSTTGTGGGGGSPNLLPVP